MLDKNQLIVFIKRAKMSIREIPADLLEIAERDLNEDPKRRQNDIDAIKKWLKKQTHITARQDDQWILTFLRGCKFSLERTKEKIDTYYTFKTLLPEFFANRDPMQPGINSVLKLGSSTLLPKPDKKGRSIFLIRTGLTNPKTHSILDIMKINYINMDVTLLSSDRAIIAGDVVVLDFKGVTLDHMKLMSPSMIKKSMKAYQDAYPIRPQAIHYINMNPIVETTFNLFKSFMKKKLQDRLFLHGNDFTKLYEHIPKELLPSDYGGELATADELSREWINKVLSYREWFIDDAKYGTDEKKRPGKPKTTSEVFGIEGSFRTLEVD